MLTTPVLHPELLSHLGKAGHLSTLLITDSNYPHATHPNPRVPRMWCNYVPGVLDAVTVLKMVCSVVPIEAATIMKPDEDGRYASDESPAIWSDYQDVLDTEAHLTEPMRPLLKPEFNRLAKSDDLALVIATAERQGYANILLTIGVVP